MRKLFLILLAVFLLIIVGIGVVTLKIVRYGTVPRNVHYPSFDAEYLYCVNGTGHINKIDLQSLPIQLAEKIELDIGLYLMSICVVAEELYVYGHQSDYQSTVVRGIYQVDPSSGITELIYHSENHRIGMMLGCTNDGRSFLIATLETGIIVFDVDRKKVVQEIGFEFKPSRIGLIAGELFVVYDEVGRNLYSKKIWSDDDFILVENVSKMFAGESKVGLPIEQDGEWFLLDADQGLHRLGKQWVRQNIRDFEAYPRNALEDQNGSFVQLVENELYSKTFFKFEGQHIGNVRGSVFDLCID